MRYREHATEAARGRSEWMQGTIFIFFIVFNSTSEHDDDASDDRTWRTTSHLILTCFYLSFFWWLIFCILEHTEINENIEEARPEPTSSFVSENVKTNRRVFSAMR